MITLTVAVPSPAAVIAQTFTQLQLLKSSSQTSIGPYVSIPGTLIPITADQTSYSLVDVVGTWGDWYATQYVTTLGAVSAPGTATPGYFSDLTSTIRDLLGVSTTHVSDSQIAGFAYLPAALARIRQRFRLFDATIAAGGDVAGLCLGALAHLVAALLCPRMTVQVVDSEWFDKYKYQLNRQMDWGATAAALMVQYEILISQAAGETDVPRTSYVPGVLLAGPVRGGSDNAGGLVPFNPDPYENPLLPYNPDINPN